MILKAVDAFLNWHSAPAEKKFAVPLRLIEAIAAARYRVPREQVHASIVNGKVALSVSVVKDAPQATVSWTACDEEDRVWVRFSGLTLLVHREGDDTLVSVYKDGAESNEPVLETLVSRSDAEALAKAFAPHFEG